MDGMISTNKMIVKGRKYIRTDMKTLKTMSHITEVRETLTPGIEAVF